MKALVMPNIHTCLARGSLSKHLQNSIIHTLGVENDKVGQSPPNCDTPRRCKMCKISFCLKKVMFYEKKTPTAVHIFWLITFQIFRAFIFIYLWTAIFEFTNDTCIVTIKHTHNKYRART